MASILPILFLLDLLIPFSLAPFYKGYDHLTQVMSVLGNPKAPLHLIYNSWLILFGIALLFGGSQLYPAVAGTSKTAAAALFTVIGAYAIGGCILSGIFSVEETKSLETLSARIHGYGSAIGFLFLCFAPLLVGIYFIKKADWGLGVFSLVCFFFAVGFFVLFVMADKPSYKGTVIALEGLWQRLSLCSMYLPVMALCAFRE